jgi:hypothetical protein
MNKPVKTQVQTDGRIRKWRYIEEMGKYLRIEPISKSVSAYSLSFPQAERVGNPFENKERFRTSRNDIRTA